MKGKITLANPIKVDGKMVSELEYCTDGISVEDFSKACSKAITKGGNLTGTSLVLDYPVHLYLGFFAVIASNPEITLLDMEKQIKGYDVVKISQIGQVFTAGVGEQTRDSLEGLLENTQEPSTPA